MSSQTYLTENPPMILDATCSFGRVWPAFATLRIDRRKVVRPDIVADDCYLPFKDGIFSAIYCDPPHLIRTDGWLANAPPGVSFRAWKDERANISGEDVSLYGKWGTREEWESYLRATDKEFDRTLSQNGELHYKLTHGADRRITKRKDIGLMESIKVVSERITKSKSNFPGKNSVHWLTMKPKSAVAAALRKDGVA